jgi:predicted nucleic acid-binding Zn ribbon protein
MPDLPISPDPCDDCGAVLDSEEQCPDYPTLCGRCAGNHLSTMYEAMGSRVGSGGWYRDGSAEEAAAERRRHVGK